ncbi:MAG: hypothetical protein GY823_05115 [Flavobacteriaceae bacterium]|nr:hypothetical protein [Flavobacteriaceae bacterium]
MTPLRKQMIEAMTLKRLAKKTQEAYLHAVEELSKYYNKSPEFMTDDEVKDFIYFIQTKRNWRCFKKYADIRY